MEKLKSAFSSTSAVSSKLTKAFKFNSDHNVLHRTQTSNGQRWNGGNPFLDGPNLEEPSLPRAHLIIHVVAIFFTFLAICTMGAVASFQSKWFSTSGGTGFTIFLLLLSFLLSAFLLLVPIIYDRWDRLKRPAQFLAQTRTTFILHTFGTFTVLLAAFIVTISAWTAKGCKNADNDPHASLGNGYKDGLKQWCTTKKASAIFDWFAFGAWTALLVLTALTFRRERQQSRREPGFIPPDSTGISYSNILAADDERYADKTAPLSSNAAATGQDDVPGGYGYPTSNRAGAGTGVGASRPSVDAYGAFDGDGMPHSNDDTEPSRTMQLAYNDPYAQIRASLMHDPNSHAGYAQAASQPGLYANGGLPNPPAYGGGYR
ncbi:hypothetical protein CI109_105576 [Kwoniella shandongensis]|uniref:Uncharacterized protein n=1 Tax=Kwoniella shandongensis TaxID=1734106 RepID=A0A5M6C3W2_9TREE|nr:uncharacterized protein CI109_002293 [Kwoniella shandongensis]KAA5529400.1 hypothetical protein CI109_002293 [Kwoniella shandongensis]